MKYLKIPMLLLPLCCLHFQSFGQSNQASWDAIDAHEVPEWWKEAKFIGAHIRYRLMHR